MSLLKRDQQPVSSGPTRTQTHTYGSTNTHEPTQAQRDTEILSGLYSQLGRRGRERDGGQREGRKMRRMSETDRWRGGRGGRGGGRRLRGEEQRKTEAREKSENAWSHWWAVGVRTRQLTSIRVSQTSAALYLVEQSSPWQHTRTSSR